MIDPLIAEGALPHFAALAKDGVSADLATVEPVNSPTVWTSIATGRSPEAHGITNFFDTALDRQVPTVFERLAAGGRRVGLYDYLATWPPPSFAARLRDPRLDPPRRRGDARGRLRPSGAGAALSLLHRRAAAALRAPRRRAGGAAAEGAPVARPRPGLRRRGGRRDLLRGGRPLPPLLARRLPGAVRGGRAGARPGERRRDPRGDGGSGPRPRRDPRAPSGPRTCSSWPRTTASRPRTAARPASGPRASSSPSARRASTPSATPSASSASSTR